MAGPPASSQRPSGPRVSAEFRRGSCDNTSTPSRVIARSVSSVVTPTASACANAGNVFPAQHRVRRGAPADQRQGRCTHKEQGGQQTEANHARTIARSRPPDSPVKPAIDSTGVGTDDALLLGVRPAGHHARAGRRLAPACLLRSLRRHSLCQSTASGRHDPGVGRRRFYCANARSNRATESGHCPPASWRSAKRPAQGALRETLEEAGARISLGPLFSMIECRMSSRSTFFSGPNCSISTFVARK